MNAQAPKNNDQENKPRMSLIPIDLLGKYLCPAYEEGILKYYKNSWRKGFKFSVMIDAALRHISKFADEGEDFDKETFEKYGIKKHHIAAVLFCCLSILNDIEHNRTDNDDRYKE